MWYDGFVIERTRRFMTPEFIAIVAVGVVVVGLGLTILQIMLKRFEQVDRRFERVDRRFEQVDARFERLMHGSSGWTPVWRGLSSA